MKEEGRRRGWVGVGRLVGWGWNENGKEKKDTGMRKEEMTKGRIKESRM